MSLKFGIYLVEQRIISPEQFCGLVKIQQEALASLATVAIRKNMMTIKQVADVLDQQELAPEKSFVQIAIASDFLDRPDAEQLIQEQRRTCPSIRTLVQQCGLLTERQCNVLFQHYQKTGTRPIPGSKPIPRSESPGRSTDREMIPNAVPAIPPRPPKFKQRPVIVSQYSDPASG